MRSCCLHYEVNLTRTGPSPSFTYFLCSEDEQSHKYTDTQERMAHSQKRTYDEHRSEIELPNSDHAKDRAPSLLRRSISSERRPSPQRPSTEQRSQVILVLDLQLLQDLSLNMTAMSSTLFTVNRTDAATRWKFSEDALLDWSSSQHSVRS